MTENTQYNSHMLTLMKEQGLKKGTLLEVTLAKDAAWYNGDTPAPTTNQRGYERYDPEYFNESDLRSGMRVGGFVCGIDYHQGRVLLKPTWHSLPGKEATIYDLGAYFVESNVIADFTWKGLKPSTREIENAANELVTDIDARIEKAAKVVEGGIEKAVKFIDRVFS